MELYLTLLISLHMIPIQVARGQNSILRSNVCQNISSNAQCAAEYHTLTCPANASIFILEAENDFVFSPSPQASCAGGVCDEQCCSRDNFQCSYPLSSDSFLSYINSCWGYRMCTNNAAFNPRTLTEGNRNCSGTAALASVSYLCINNLSVVRFDDKRNVSGTAVVARYLDTETNTSSCLEPQNTLKCDITLVGAGSKGDVRVMLVLRHPQLANNCSMLSIPEKNLSSDSQSCKQSLVTYNTANITLPGNSASQSIELTLLEGNHPIQAWAVVISNTASLEMQCGRGTCTPTAVTSTTAASSTSTSATTNSSQTPTASPLTTTTENSSPTSSSSSQAGDPKDASTSPGSSNSTDNSTSTTSSPSSTKMSSSTETALSSTDTSAFSSHSDTSPPINLTSTQREAGKPSNVAAIVGGVVGGAIAIVLAIAIIVVCYRRRSSAKKFHSSDDGEVNPVALDDTKREPLDGERPPSDYEDVDDPVPGRRRVSYSSILLEADETPSTPPPDDSESDYDHLRQRRPTSNPLSDVTYGRLGEVDADDDPDYDYDRLGCSIKRGTPDPEASQEDPYSRLHVMGKTPDVEPGDDAGIADDVTGDVTADDVNIKESNASETKL